LVLDRYIVDLCQGIATASSSSDLGWSLVIDADPLIISTDVAVPLGLVVNELVTNAIQHSQPLGKGGSIRIALKRHSDTFSINVTDPGDGAVADPDSSWIRYPTLRAGNSNRRGADAPNQCNGYKRSFAPRLFRYSDSSSQRVCLIEVSARHYRSRERRSVTDQGEARHQSVRFFRNWQNS
jgi:anti-sigma regulatory factor (Ser/Thr protein kinase)